MANFRKAIFNEADVEGIGLVGANLDGADMHSLVWLNSDLSRASMRRATLEGSLFRSCSLVRVDANSASLANTVIVNCNLSGIDLTYGRLNNCLWQDVMLDSAIAEGTDLTKAKLLQSSARNTFLSRAQRQQLPSTSQHFRASRH